MSLESRYHRLEGFDLAKEKRKKLLVNYNGRVRFRSPLADVYVTSPYGKIKDPKKISSYVLIELKDPAFVEAPGGKVVKRDEITVPFWNIRPAKKYHSPGTEPKTLYKRPRH
jgi:hypothetical protein